MKLLIHMETIWLVAVEVQSQLDDVVAIMGAIPYIGIGAAGYDVYKSQTYKPSFLPANCSE